MRSPRARGRLTSSTATRSSVLPSGALIRRISDASVGQGHAREDTRTSGHDVVRPDRDPLAEHGAVGDLGALADATARGDDAVAQRAAWADLACRS